MQIWVVAIIGFILGFLVAYLWVQLTIRKNQEVNIQDHPLIAEFKKNKDLIYEELHTQRQANQELNKQLATAENDLVHYKNKLNDQVQELENLNQKFTSQFENLASKILDDRAQKFKEENKGQLDQILIPLKERIKEFEHKVDKVYHEENKERVHLKAEIMQLAQLNKQLSSEANNLAEALKGSNKQQGNWGELILSKILERSGLKEGYEYTSQYTDENIEGDRIRPDVVVSLPDNKHIVIDSKVSLIAYTSMIEAPETDQDRYLRAHVDSIRTHIKVLGEKHYTTAKKLNSPDFVLLFMPIEGAFSLALQKDTDLYNYAWDRKVVIVSPTTLLATLRTVANIWPQEKRTRNAEEIAIEAGKLYDKFKGFTDDLIEIGTKMNMAKKSYDEAMNKLSTGTGNLVGRAEKMRKLGARTTKDINPKLVEKSEDHTSFLE